MEEVIEQEEITRMHHSREIAGMPQAREEILVAEVAAEQETAGNKSRFTIKPGSKSFRVLFYFLRGL